MPLEINSRGIFYASTSCLDFFFFVGADVLKTILFSCASTSTTTSAPSLNLPASNSTESGLSTYFWIALRRGRAPNAGS